MRCLPLALFLAGLAPLAHAGDPTPTSDATAALKSAMGGPALDAVTRFDYRLTVTDAQGGTLRDGRYVLLPAQRVLQLDDFTRGTRLWSEPALSWRLHEGQWDTLDDATAAPFRRHVATHFVSLLRDPRTQVATKGAGVLRLAPVEADAFDVALDPATGRILENRFDDGAVAAESEYQSVSGLWWPMHFEVRDRGQTRVAGQFRDVIAHADAATLPTMPVDAVPATLPDAPSDAASLVGAGWVSGVDNDYNFNTDADGTRLVFARSQADFKDARILTARREGDGWQTPRPVPFTDPRYSDSDPWLTPDGTVLYFVSNRPLQGEAPRKDLEIWRVAISADGFGTPQHLAMLGSDGQELGPELHDGWLYFNSTRKGGPARMAIWRARVQGDGFGAPEALGAPFNDGAVQGDFTLSPDGNTALFWSVRGESKDPDLFATRRAGQGWSPALRLPAPINAPGMDFTPSFSADGRALYFASERKPSWLDEATHVFNGQANAWVVRADVVTRALDAMPAP